MSPRRIYPCMGRYSKRPCRCSSRQRGLTGGFWTTSTKKLLLASIHSFKCCQNTAGIKFSMPSISWPGQEALSCAAIGMTIRCFLLHTRPKLSCLVHFLARILPLTSLGHSLRLFPYISEFLSMLDDLSECELVERLAPESGQRANGSPLGFIVGKHRLRRMTDDLPFHHVDDEFGHICRVVGDTFQVLADKGQANSARNRSRIFDHEGEEFAKQLVREIVNKVIVRADLPRLRRIRTHKRVQGFSHHLHSPIGHPRNIDIRLELRLFIQFDDSFANVFC